MSDSNPNAAVDALAKGLSVNERLAKITLHVAQCAAYLLQGRDALYAEVQPLLDELLKQGKAKGFTLSLLSSFRTFIYQDTLYAEGRSVDGQIVTNAKGGESYHNYGLAFDIQGTDPNGGPLSDADNQALGELGASLGLVWGGTFQDYHHFEWHPDFAWQDLITIFSRATDPQ